MNLVLSPSTEYFPSSPSPPPSPPSFNPHRFSFSLPLDFYTKTRPASRHHSMIPSHVPHVITCQCNYSFNPSHRKTCADSRIHINFALILCKHIECFIFPGKVVFQDCVSEGVKRVREIARRTESLKHGDIDISKNPLPLHVLRSLHPSTPPPLLHTPFNPAFPPTSLSSLIPPPLFITKPSPPPSSPKRSETNS